MRGLILFLSFLVAATPASASRHGWDKASTIAAAGLGVAALGGSAAAGDWRGALQLGESAGVAEAGAQGLKALIHERRPDGSDRKSFPSGHAAVTFSIAASLDNRYGWRAGLPAAMVATFVGVARVEARKHHWYDVVAGAGVGSASGFLLTRRLNDRVQLTPWADGGGGGIAMGLRF